jgi:hypothetical protein
MNCNKFRKWLSDVLDRELTEKKQQLLQRHLEECAPCRSYKESIEKINTESKSLEKPKLASEYWQMFNSRLKTKLLSIEPEEFISKPFLSRWKWAWAAAGSILITTVGLYFLFFQAKATPETYAFSYEDVLSQIYQEIGNNSELENSFNQLILASIQETLQGNLPRNFSDDPYFWESLTEEDLKFLESEIKKESNS